jgi:glycosyltransferase involved in cell wall biosynthesis
MPAWNEEDSVGATIAEVHAAVPDADVLVVDDGSADRTGERARSAGALLLTLPFNLGVGGAMRAGFKYAARHDYDAVVQVDADGQHDARDIPEVVAGLQVADVVIGARFADRGAYSVKGPRRWAMALLARTLSRLARTRLTDTTSGFRAANRRAVSLYARHYPAEYLGDTVESLVIALRSGYRVTQVPVEMRARRGGVPSHAPWKAGVYLMRAFLALGLALFRRWPDLPGLDDRREASA